MIMIFAGRRDDRCALHVAGHAGYANKGQDIVCAAVSTLVNNLAGALASTPSSSPVTRASPVPPAVPPTCCSTPPSSVWRS